MRIFTGIFLISVITTGCTEPVTPPGPEAAEFGDYIAGGTEPFWGVEIMGGAISFSTPDQNNFTLPVSRTKKTADGWTVQGFSDAHNVNLYIESDVKCSDGMSDRIYADTVKVEASNSGTMTGCGGEILQGGNTAP